jgi:hypothetical protein
MLIEMNTNYSGLAGSLRRGWRRDVPDELAGQLIRAGVAEAVVEPVDEPEQPEVAKPVRRARKAKRPEQYVNAPAEIP